MLYLLYKNMQIHFSVLFPNIALATCTVGIDSHELTNSIDEERAC